MENGGNLIDKLKGIIVDWSNAQINGIKFAFGEERGEEVLTCVVARYYYMIISYIILSSLFILSLLLCLRPSVRPEPESITGSNLTPVKHPSFLGISELLRYRSSRSKELAMALC